MSGENLVKFLLGTLASVRDRALGCFARSPKSLVRHAYAWSHHVWGKPGLRLITVLEHSFIIRKPFFFWVRPAEARQRYGKPGAKAARPVYTDQLPEKHDPIASHPGPSQSGPDEVIISKEVQPEGGSARTIMAMRSPVSPKIEIVSTMWICPRSFSNAPRPPERRLR